MVYGRVFFPDFDEFSFDVSAIRSLNLRKFKINESEPADVSLPDRREHFTEVVVFSEFGQPKQLICELQTE